MKKIVLIIPLIILGFLSTVSAYSLVVENYSTTPDSSSSVTNNSWRGQTFWSPNSGTVNQIQLWFNITDSGNYTVIIQNNTANAAQPNGQNVSVGTFVPGVGTQLRAINISLSPGMILAGFNYTIFVLNNKTSGSDNGPWIVGTGTYPRGTFVSTNDAGGSWSSGSQDMPFTLYLNQTVNLVILNSPTNGIMTSNTSINFTTSAFTIPYNITNTTLYLWKSGSLVNTTVTTFGSGIQIANTSTVVSSLSPGQYSWNYLWCSTNVTIDTCNFALTNYTFTLGASLNSNSYNSTTYETAYEGFVTNVTLPTGYTLSSATLYWNNTSYTGTVSSDNTPILSSAFDIPSVNTTVSWFWSILFSNGFQQNLSSNSQAVNSINFSYCSGPPQNVPYLNFTFKNESTNQESMNASIVSTWTYWLGSGSVNKTYSFSNSSTNAMYGFCFRPGDRQLYALPSVTYSEPSSQTRTYIPGSISLTNSTTNQVLYLLSTPTGLFVTFQVVNTGQQTLEGASILISRSGYGNITSGTTDSAGSYTAFLSSGACYTIQTSYTGLATDIRSICASQSQYTVTLGDAVIGNATDYLQGITYLTGPQLPNLQNNTVYTFNFTLSSSYWAVSQFGFNLVNASGYSLGSSSSNSNGGTVSSDISTGNQTFLRMNYFWVINGTYSNGSVNWVVFSSDDTGYSISNLGNDLRTYASQGMFGLDNFGLTIICFFAIFIITGVTSYKFGFDSPASIGALACTLILFFDVGLGLIPTPSAAVPHFASIFAVIIFISLVLREVTN